jgi:hypothetical protein
MLIRKHIAEATEDMTSFNGKVEIETDNHEEWDKLLKVLSTLGEDGEYETVCHCNVKVNAETIAKILEYDSLNVVAPYVPFFPNLVEDAQEGK